MQTMRTMFSAVVFVIGLMFAAQPVSGFATTDATTAEAGRVASLMTRFQELFSTEDVTGLIREIYHPECEFWLWDRNAQTFKKYIGIAGMVDYVRLMFAMLSGPAGFREQEIRIFPTRVNVIWDKVDDGLNEENVIFTFQDNDDGDLRIIHADIYYDGVSLDEFEPIPYTPPPDLVDIVNP